VTAAGLYAACGGSVILEEGASGAGGNGGEGGDGGSQASSNVATTGFGPSTAISVGTGPMPSCVTCGQFIMEGQGTLCPESEGYYKELFYCVCAESCIPQCGNNVCSNGPATDDCANCITTACNNQLNACANDF
jgi:hypothetical protein